MTSYNCLTVIMALSCTFLIYLISKNIAIPNSKYGSEVTQEKNDNKDDVITKLLAFDHDLTS